MAANILRRTHLLLTPAKSPAVLFPQLPHRTFTTSPLRSLPLATIDSDLISQITAFEKEHTKSDSPMPGGPTAIAQSQVGARINEAVIRSILDGERKITGPKVGPVKNGPAALARRAMQAAPEFWSLKEANKRAGIRAIMDRNDGGEGKPAGKLDSETIAKVTEKEKEITGQDDPVKGGPTAKAQSHAGEPITSQALHDITEGEKKVTGGERIKGGPTSTTQSELARARASD